MYIPFETMPGFSRLWIYQANRKFTEPEKILLEKGLRHLCDQWSAHGSPLETSFHLEYDQFILLAINEQKAGVSGCSIDGSVRLLKSLQGGAGLDFFDRTKVAFLINGTVVLNSLSDLENLFRTKTLSEGATTFNNTVLTKAELERQWKIPVKETWLARFLPKATVGGSAS